MRGDNVLEPDVGPGWRAWLAWGTAAVFYLYEFFARVAPSVMERSMQDDLHVGAAAMGAALGAYFYIYAPLQLVVGGVIDRLGPKYTLAPAVILVAAGCALESFTVNVEMVAAARILQGAGSAFAFVGTVYVAATWFPHRRLALLAGLTTALGMAGGIIGNAGIQNISEAIGWRTTLQGAALFGLGLAVVLFLVLQNRRQSDSGDAEIEGSTPLPFFQAFKVVFSNPQTWLIGLVSACLYAPLPVLGDLWGNRYIVSVTGTDTATASRIVSMLFVGWLIGAPIAGWVSDRFRRRKLILVWATALTFVVTALLIFLPTLEPVPAGALFFIMGVVSCGQIVTFVASIEVNPVLCRGIALSAVNMVVMVVGGLLQPAAGFLLDQIAGPEVTDYSGTEFRQAMIILPALALAGFVLTFFLRESHPGEPEVEEMESP